MPFRSPLCRRLVCAVQRIVVRIISPDLAFGILGCTARVQRCIAVQELAGLQTCSRQQCMLHACGLDALAWTGSV
jgi:hypothetical protein